MATNYFLGTYWTRTRLEEFRTAIQTTRLTGQVIRIKTGPGQETEFDPKSTDLTELLTQVQYAISQLEDADPDNPNDVNPYDRPGYTTPIFCR